MTSVTFGWLFDGLTGVGLAAVDSAVVDSAVVDSTVVVLAVVLAVVASVVTIMNAFSIANDPIVCVRGKHTMKLL